MRRFFGEIDFSRYSRLLKGPEGISKYVPISFNPASYELLKFDPLKINLSDADTFLSAPAHDILNRDAKLWRGSLCMIVAEGLGGSALNVLPLAASLEILHTASLVVDDVEDKSTMRRGKPCIHILHGEPTAINIGNYLFFLPFALVSGTSYPDPIKLKMLTALSEEMVKLTVGQGYDINWAQHGLMPTIDKYLFSIECKTSVIVRLAVKLAAIAQKADKFVQDQLILYAENIGAAFQIKDDLLNLESTDYAKGRSYLGEDITEGKRSAIVIRAVEQSTERQRLIDILNMRTPDLNLVNEALDIIRSTDALGWSNELATKHIERALESLDRLTLQVDSTAFLEGIAKFIVTRTK